MATRTKSPRDTLDAPLKVGELARRTGLTVRALHHYDAIGLLSPSLRTPSGHRLYARADVERLQQVAALRLLGIPLDETKRLLDGAALSPRAVIELQVARLREQIDLQTRLAERLEALVRHPHAVGGASLEDLCRIIEATTNMEKYFTPEQARTIDQRRETVGQDRMDAVGAEWAELIPAVQAKMDAGADPASPDVQALARRWKGLVDEFTGGDPAIGRAVRTMYEKEGPAMTDKVVAMPTPAMFPYIQKALDSMK